MKKIGSLVLTSRVYQANPDIEKSLVRNHSFNSRILKLTSLLYLRPSLSSKDGSQKINATLDWPHKAMPWSSLHNLETKKKCSFQP